MMDSTTTESGLHATEEVECWDDDDDLQFNDGLALRAVSSAGSIGNSPHRPSGRCGSISSRQSARSDPDSNAGDKDWQVLLYDNDETSKEEALASAKIAGIPLPANITNSALLGGKIKRLSSRKPKRTFADDWSDEIELPGPDATLELKYPLESTFPESIPQFSSTATSPVRSTASLPWDENISPRSKPTRASLDRSSDGKDASTGSIVPTMKASIHQYLQAGPPVAERARLFQQESDDFDRDLELPPVSQPLELSFQKDNAGNSNSCLDEFDLEWSEGSIGVRVGGTARDIRSIPSSSISIASPSVSSCRTGESEDDGLDGIILPDGPLDLNNSLRKRREADTIHASPNLRERQDLPNMSDAGDFFSGIEIDNGKIFASEKLSLNPNVKCSTGWPASPTSRTATTLTFTNPSISSRTRIPRLSSHERTHSTHLETVSESGAPPPKFQSPQSRLGHSSQFSISSVPGTATLTPSPTQIPTHGRRMFGTRIARNTAHARESYNPIKHLPTKGPLPAESGGYFAAPARISQLPPVHQDESIRSYNRPKNSIQRTTVDARSTISKRQAPLIPLDVSERQSHHPGVKTYRSPGRTNSDSSSDFSIRQGIHSRLSHFTRFDRMRLILGDMNSEKANSGGKSTLSRPTMRRNFGDGTELESFDDLPTSASAESKFVKTPIGRGEPRSVRARLSHPRFTPARESTAHSSTPYSASRSSSQMPRFARDTNASRNAREQRIASMNARNREANPLGSFNSDWKAHSVSRISPAAAPIRSRKPKSGAKAPSKPHLIKAMGLGVHEAKCNEPRPTILNDWTNSHVNLVVSGMRYNPATFRWEGNENLVQDFESLAAPKSPKPTPALITNMGAVQNVQSIGGMIFDPRRMCWLRARTSEYGCQEGIPPEDEDDVFAGLDDLEDPAVGVSSSALNALDNSYDHPREDPSASESSDEGPITEEFDVGPEFVRRQRAEEEKWRRKVDQWIDFDRENREPPWRWIIRDLVADGMGDQAA